MELSGHHVKIYRTLCIVYVYKSTVFQYFVCGLLELYPDIISVQIYTWTDK